MSQGKRKKDWPNGFDITKMLPVKKGVGKESVRWTRKKSGLIETRVKGKEERGGKKNNIQGGGKKVLDKRKGSQIRVVNHSPFPRGRKHFPRSEQGGKTRGKDERKRSLRILRRKMSEPN